MPTAPPNREDGGAASASAFYVPPILDFLGWWTEQGGDFWLGLGRLESRLLAPQLAAIDASGPIYVAGLARSGSTLLHEIIASHPGVACHRIKDYPMVFTPYWWRQATAGGKPGTPRERAHADRVFITAESPDALEEMIWTAFFPRCHDPSTDNRLDASVHKPAFEDFYPKHIRKLLLAEKASRYAAKANYHIARLPYLARLFPDARFILPVRAPVGHIASLIRQHENFSSGQRGNRRALAFMRRSGHFEFGRDRRPIHLGDDQRVRAVQRAWEVGDEARGGAIYWDMIHAHLAHLLESDPLVRAMTLVVRFEELCAAPEKTIRAVLDHCRLPDADAVVERFTGQVRAPDYYKHSFSPADLAAIREETAVTAAAWGY
jgi:hypothetical protein